MGRFTFEPGSLIKVTDPDEIAELEAHRDCQILPRGDGLGPRAGPSSIPREPSMLSWRAALGIRTTQGARRTLICRRSHHGFPSHPHGCLLFIMYGTRCPVVKMRDARKQASAHCVLFQRCGGASGYSSLYHTCRQVAGLGVIWHVREPISAPVAAL